LYWGCFSDLLIWLLSPSGTGVRQVVEYQGVVLMSSSNDLFGPEDFENLIAAVDSLEIPIDDESSSSPSLIRTTAKTENSQSDTRIKSAAADTSTFAVAGDPFGKSGSANLQLESDDEFADFEDLTAEYSELNFDEDSENADTFSPSTRFASASKQVKKAQFSVDDPFQSPAIPQKSAPVKNEMRIDDEDDLVDMYASFLEATSDDPKPIEPSLTLQNKSQASNEDDEFADFSVFTTSQPQSENTVNYFAFEDEAGSAEIFDGVAAANEISALWNEEHSEPQPLSVTTTQNEPLMDSITKTKMAANKLKAHLESLNAKSPAANIPSQHDKFVKPVLNSESLEVDPEFADLASQATQNQAESQSLHIEAQNEFADIAFLDAVEDANKPENLFPRRQEHSPADVLSEKVSEKIKESVTLTRKTEVITDNLLAAFVESTLSSKQKVRALSVQNFARKFPKLYLASTTVLALAGFVYILAIPALLVITMLNGFEMLNSPFTDDVVMLLVALFSISLFLFMVGYKLFDLKFVGPGGITLNHENANALIEKLQQLKNEKGIPKIHDVILTRRHELNLIKIPRFGLPIWSKNVLAIGYPLLQTLPADYFDVALVRRLAQFNKRKNMLHNWLSFMRRTWTIYAVSLKARKGVIDLLHYCFFAPYASAYRSFAVYISQKDELMADEKALQYCNDRDLMKTAQTLRITRAMLLQYFWPKLNEDLQTNTAAPHYVQPYTILPETLNTLLRSKNVDAWFIRLGQEDVNPGDAEAPFALRMQALGQRKVAIPDAFETSAAQHYFDVQYNKMTDLLNSLWAEEVQKELFEKNIHKGGEEISLPCHLAIEPA